MTARHPFGPALRDLRTNLGLSLGQIEHRTQGRHKAVVIGSYERADRCPSVNNLDLALRDLYNSRLAIVHRDMTTEHLELASWLAGQDVSDAEVRAAVALVRAAREARPGLRAVA